MYQLTVHKSPEGDYGLSFFVSNGKLSIRNVHYSDQPWEIPIRKLIRLGEQAIIVGADLKRGYNSLTLKLKSYEKDLLKIEIVGLSPDEETVWVISLDEFNSHLFDEDRAVFVMPLRDNEIDGWGE